MCDVVVSWLNTSSPSVQFSVGKVRIGFPLKLQVHDVSAVRTSNGQTLFGLQRLEAGLDDIPWGQPYFVVKKLEVEGVMLGMDSLTQSLGVLGGVDALRVNDVKVDPMEQDVRIGEVILTSPGLLLYIAPSPADTIQSSGTPWSINIDNVLLRDGNVDISISDSSLVDALASVSMTDYLDYHHLTLVDINLAARNFGYWEDVPADSLSEGMMHLAVMVDSLRVLEANSEVNIRKAAVDFRMNGSVINADSITLQLDKSRLSGWAEMDLALTDSIQNGMARANLKADLNHTELLQIAGGYVPEMLQEWINGDVKLDADFQLKVTPYDSLTAAKLKKTHEVVPVANIEAEVNYGDSLIMNLVTRVDKSDISLTANMVEDKRDILYVSGKGNINDETYKCELRAKDLNIGHFLPEIAVHRLDAHAHVEGHHFQVPGRSTFIAASAELERITFTTPEGRFDSLVNVTAAAQLKQGQYMAQVTSRHPTLELNSFIEGLLRQDTVSASGYIELPYTNLSQLPAGLGVEGLGYLDIDAKVDGGWNWKNFAKLHMDVDSLRYADAYGTVDYNGIVLDYKSDSELMHAYLNAGDAHLNIDVQTNITNLPDVSARIQRAVEEQYKECRINVAEIETEMPKFDISIDMEQENPLYSFVQYYGYAFDKIHLRANNHPHLNVDSHIVGLVSSDGLDIDSAMFRLKPNADKEQVYGFASHVLRIAPKAKNSYNLHTSGEIWPDSAMVDLRYEDGNYVTRYDAALSLRLAEDSLTLHLEKDPIFYGERFAVNRDNFLSVMNFLNLDDSGLNSRARILLDGEHGTSLHVYTRTAYEERLDAVPVAGNQLLVVVRDADLAQMGRDMGKPDLMSGKATVAAAANLFPDSLTLAVRMQSTDVRLKSYRADSITFNGRVDLVGRPGQRHHRAEAKGLLKVEDVVKLNLNANLTDSVNILATIDDLPLELSNMMLPDDVSMRGFLNGKVTVRGKDMDHTRMDGVLWMRKGGIEITDMDANLSLSEDSIRLRNNRLRIRGLSLIGTNKNKLTVSGTVDLRKSMSNPKIDLSVQGKDVRIIDSKKLRTKSQYIYGRLPVSVDMNVLGTVDNLKVKGSLNVLSGTNLTCYLQDDPLQQQSKVDGLVEFVNFRQLDRQQRVKKPTFNQPVPMEDAVNDELDVQFVIDIARDARVRAYLPGVEKNYASLTGGGQIKVIYDGTSRLQTSGYYDVVDGSLYYKLPVIPVSKNFKITSSSSLNWNGQLDNPNINIQASEEVKATVNDESSGSRIVRFLVTIDITGTLSALDLKFHCTSPEDGTLNTELASMTDDENSKAAIMLLLAQTYMGPGSTNSMGLSSANTAVSSIINKQIESAFGAVAPQVNVGIDTYDTEAGGQRTEYSVKLSQKFGDRFRATIGGKVSQGAAANGQSNGAQLGDISFEWLIKKDGSHYLRLFRKTNFESVLDGQIIETGAGYVQESSGYRFRDLLIPASKKRQQRIEQVVRELQEKERKEEREKLGIRGGNRGGQRKSQRDSQVDTQTDSLRNDKTIKR